MEDIDALKEELALLRSRVADLNDFIEQGAMPLHWVDRNGIIIWANQAELDLVGYSREEYIGQPIASFHADQHTINDILRRLSADETIINYPAQLTCKNGGIKQVLINSNVKRESGEFVHTRCFTRDMTAFVQEEKRMADVFTDLEQSEARLLMAMESTGLGTWDYNPISGQLTWSEQCKKIYGLPLGEEVDFDAFSKHIYSEDSAFVLREIGKSMDPGGDGRYDITYRITRFDDHNVRWIRAQGKVYLNSERQAERFIGTVIDITENKLALEKSAKLAAIVDSSDDAIISKNFDSIITSWNDSAERMFGYTAAEMIGQSILKLIPADRQEEEPEILARLKTGHRMEHFETKRLTKSGSLLDVSLTISPVKDAEGNIIGLSKIARDITEKKQEEMRKNDFIAMVSHELKTPLTSMKSYLQVLLKVAKKDGHEFRINALTRAEAQAQKMTIMINDFLNLARLEEGKIELRKTRFELHPLVEEIASDAPYMTSGHHIRLVDCEKIILEADRDKIGQVLNNLLSNAIKYSPKGGTITIGCEKLAAKVKIFVKDEGVGISPADQKRLFERFYRSKDEKIKTVSGFGIGLYLVAEILRLHGSRIGVESIEGEGSTFYFMMDCVG
jgi:two-component system, OmpR family, sensor histidine kinase VicK